MMVSTSDLCDAFPHDVHVLEPIFRCYGRRRSFAGRIATVRCFEDNSAVREYSAKPGEGRVLVVDGGGSLRRALLGDQIAAAFVRNGWVGIVINGCIRDVEALNAMDLGIRALNSIPVKTERRGRGETDGQLRFAGVAIRAGQWLYADETGVLVADRQLGPE